MLRFLLATKLFIKVAFTIRGRKFTEKNIFYSNGLVYRVGPSLLSVSRRDVRRIVWFDCDVIRTSWSCFFPNQVETDIRCQFRYFKLSPKRKLDQCQVKGFYFPNVRNFSAFHFEIVSLVMYLLVGTECTYYCTYILL